MARRKIKLEIIDQPHPKASVLALTITPAIKGDDDEDLLCGGCGVVLCESFSRDTSASLFMAPAQMLLTCPKCGAHNRLPAQVGH